MSPDAILSGLLSAPPIQLDALPTEQGIYALYDHTGTSRYIGITQMGLKRRIWNYHVGGDDNSHKYSTIYNAGRMFHSRNDIQTDKLDGPVAKKLRRLFARQHCRAVGIPLPGLDKAELFAIETEVRRLAPAEALSWNNLRGLDAYEPVEAVDAFLKKILWEPKLLAAVARQSERWKHRQTMGSLPRN